MTDEQKRAPDPDWLRKKVSEGLSQQQIADAWEIESGYRVSRSTIAMAIRLASDGRESR